MIEQLDNYCNDSSKKEIEEIHTNEKSKIIFFLTTGSYKNNETND